MILRALTDYYEAMAQRGLISPRGWSSAKVSYALVLNADGELIDLLLTKQEVPRGKSTAWVPCVMQVPAQSGRSVGIAPNFLADNSSYLLGIDEKGKPQRSVECFQASAAYHKKILADIDCAAAHAVCAFFDTWKIETAREHPVLQPYLEDIFTASNLVFRVNGKFAQENQEICRAWNAQNAEPVIPNGICAVTGVPDKIAEKHPPIRGVRGAQSSGAALVSFNAPAFCSYGKEQSVNSSVGSAAAFAYTTALNQLLSDHDHTKFMGDTTLLYWAENADPAYIDAMSDFVEGNDSLEENDIKAALHAFSKGNSYELNGKMLDPSVTFCVLGIAPNAARLSIRFFYKDSFGALASNIEQHYQRLEIANQRRRLSVWMLLNETVNQKATDKSASPLLAGAVLRAIVQNTEYPAVLYHQTMLRIGAEKQVSYGKAAIIKAYLLKRAERVQTINKEALQVTLDETCDDMAYVLGRIFAVLENIQHAATGATTVKDKYFNSACAMPATIFPLLLRLESSHIRVLRRDKKALANNLENKLTELMKRIKSEFPKHLPILEQGLFYLGYFYQKENRYDKDVQEG